MLRNVRDPGHVKMNARKKALKLFRIEHHICIDCGKPVETEYQRCNACRERQRFSQYKWKHKKKTREMRLKGLIE